MEIGQIVRRFSITYIINVIGSSFFNNIYILFMSTTKGFTDHEISWIMGIIPLITVPAMFIWGKILDSNKRLMGAAWIITLLNGLCLGLMFFVSQYWIFFAIALVRTLILQPMGSICEEYMINITKKAQIPYGKVRRFGTLGVGIAGLVSPVLILFIGIGGVIFTGAVIVMLSAFLYKVQPEVRLEDEQEDTKKEGVKAGISLDLLSNKSFLMVLAIVSLSYGALNSAASYGNQMILMKMNCPEMIIVSLPIILVAVEMLVLGVSHQFKVEQLPYRAMMIGILIMCVRWVMLAGATSYMMVIASTLLNGVIVGITLPAQNYLIAQVVPEKQRSTAYLLSIVVQISVVPGILNLVIGSLLGTMGTSIFGIMYLGVTVLALALNLPMIRKEKKAYYSR